MHSPVNTKKLQKVLATLCNEATLPGERARYAHGFEKMLFGAGLSYDDISFGAAADGASDRELELSAENDQLEIELNELRAENDRQHATLALRNKEIQKLRASQTRLTKKGAHLNSQLGAMKAQRTGADIETLMRDNDALLSENARLVEENARLKAAARAASSRNVHRDGGAFISYGQFEESARAKFGREHFKSAFAFHSGITLRELNAYKTVGFIPAEVASALGTMTEAQRKPASRKRWSEDELTELVELLDRGGSDLTIAKALTEKFGRPLYESSIAGRRRRSVRDQLWTPPAARTSSQRPATTLH